MTYVVTYCTFDRNAGGNPLWHSCLLFSKLNQETGLLEVVDNWGFYGVPTTNRSNSWMNQLKIKIGLDVDLTGNHGMLRHEEMRFLDLGIGLNGTSFELSEEQYNLLHASCLKMVADQYAAIHEVVDSQHIEGAPPEKTRIYAHEKYSRIIYDLEKIKAEQQKREPRLKPFELRMNWGFWGPSLAQSYNCKSQAISLLSLVLSKAQIDRLTVGGQHPTIPKYSGKMESIHLHSEGPLRRHKKASGRIVHFRDGSDAGVKLYWTVPPQNIEVRSPATKKLLEIEGNYCSEVKKVVSRLQRLEWLFRNALVPEKYESYRQDLIAQIILYYKSFAVILPKTEEKMVSGWLGFGLYLLSAPRSMSERNLLLKLREANLLFNSLYMAIVDGYEIDDSLPSCVSGSEGDSNPLEHLAAYLSVDDQKQLCRIIGRNYCEADEEDDLDSEEELFGGSALQTL